MHGPGYHDRMSPMQSAAVWLAPLAHGPRRWAGAWWRIARFASRMVAAALTPAAWRGLARRTLCAHLLRDALPILPGFALIVVALVTVLTQIVVVTAQAFGLSSYAQGLLIRVLVLELIPLTAALYVALRCTVPHGAELARLRRRGGFAALRAQGGDPVLLEMLPRVLAGAFTCIMLVAIASVTALVLVYLLIHGFTLAGLPAFTHEFGRIFSPPATLVFVLKSLWLALAVALVPTAGGAIDLTVPGRRASPELQSLLRLAAVVVLVEVLALIGNYY